MSSLSSAESSPSKRNLTLDTYLQTGSAKKLKMEPERASQTATELTPAVQKDKEVSKSHLFTVSILLSLGIPQECYCPVCGQLVSGDNTTLNKHVDECLNQEMLQDTVTRETLSGARVENQRKSSATKTIDKYFRTK